jgi:LmbE family N-acetylglucosaminyl deacetylase
VAPDADPAPGAKERIVYVVVPHPDDEFEAWALLEDRPRDYPVFVLCTHGEMTVAADGSAHQPELGERTPLPQPWGGRGSDTVRRQRLGSFSAFLDGMSALDPHLDDDLVDAGELLDGPSPFHVAVGERSARVVFDGGDGELTPAFVTAALQRTRTLRHTHLPLQQEHAVVGAAYWSTSGGSVRYTHRDHRAVHEALWHVDQGAGPQWCRTSRNDRDADLTAAVSPATYDAVMGLAPDGRRTGLFQVVYGWLGPPAGWPAGETDAGTMFSRRQSFWRRFG